jgi:Bacteriophage Sf6, terminase small subunit-like
MPESQEPPKNPTGRPSDYTDELADAICQELMLGTSMAKICLRDDMPAEGTVYRWLQAHEYFRERYAHAREVQADRMVDEVLEISDNSEYDTTTTDAGPKANAEWISRSKLRVDARLKLMALLAPKKYGKKLALEVTDERTPRQLTDAELAEIAAAQDE